MNQKNKIEKFFQNRLQGNEPEVGDWNMPSDDLWNRAKVHFPNKKKKRRLFIWFWIVGIVVLLSGSIYLTNDVYFADDKELVSLLHHDKMSVPIKSLEKPVNSLANKVDKLSSNDFSINKTVEREIIDSNPRKSLNANSTNPNNEGSQVETLDNSFDKKEKVLSKNNDHSDVSENTKTASSIISLPIKNNTHELNIAKEDAGFDYLSTLEYISSLSSRVIFDKPISLSTKPKVNIIPHKQLSYWEIGLSYSPFIASPLESLEAELEEVENYGATTKYSNFNVPITRRFNNRYSMSSGLSFARLNTDLEFIELEIYSEEEPNQVLRSVIEQTAASGSLSLNDKDTSYIEIEFIPGIDLQNGDSLFIEGRIPLSLRLYRIPFILNTHWGLGRFEFLTHSGIAIDLLEAKISDLDFNIYNRDGLISRQVNFTALRDRTIGLSVHLGVGVRYKITNNWNIGVSANLDVTDPEFSRYDLGTYYRF